MLTGCQASRGGEAFGRPTVVNPSAKPLIRACAVFECPVLASRAPAGGWIQQDLFVSSCDLKGRVSFGDLVSEEAGNASREDQGQCRPWLMGPVKPAPAAIRRFHPKNGS